MIKIAILEDEKDYIDKEVQIVTDYFQSQHQKCQIESYLSVEWFLLGLKDENFDIYILDVEMPFKNGLEVAKEIRKLYPDPVFIFVTNYVDYAVDAYEVNTYRYIPKAVLEEKLPQALGTLLPSLLLKEERYYVLKRRGLSERIPLDDIYYLKKEGKYVVIFHRKGESRIRKSLSTVFHELKSSEFIMVDKSYAVNIRHIMKINGHDLVMRNDAVVPVGISRMSKIRLQILEYWG